ncbi:dTMP kinase [Brachybacterium phenoliresistens]|uniref:dTMP kinase n=1 Tax=Brachybacterium phenoliresistens TaxID=396014 RepID=UPI0004B5DC06|nr:dTMP kinase [Brachybacterium phenoliresistens]
MSHDSPAPPPVPGLAPPFLRIPTPHRPRRGLLISFEGGDGAGKTTQISLLQQYLVSERTVDEDLVLVTREPGGTPLGERIRELVLHGDHVEDKAEALLYAADRAHHIASVVRPHLARGGLVLTDRYLDSSIAYQGAGRDLDGDEIAALSLWAVGGIIPDRTILLDLPPEALAERREAGTLDRLEQEGQEFHGQVREKFLELAAAEPERFEVINATLPREEIHRRVLDAIAEDLSRFDPTFEPAPPPSRRDEE